MAASSTCDSGDGSVDGDDPCVRRPGRPFSRQTGPAESGRERGVGSGGWSDPRMTKFVGAQVPTTPDEVSNHSVLIDVALGLCAGLFATYATNLAQRPLIWITPDSVDRHERKVRPGASSSLVAAQKTAEMLKVSTSQGTQQVWGTAIHFAVGTGWGPVYGLLRRYGGLPPVGAALASGVAMSLILDEGVVPALGLSAPNHHYHFFTRARGFAAHLVYGAAAALAAEGVGRLMGYRPGVSAPRSQRVSASLRPGMEDGR